MAANSDYILLKLKSNPKSFLMKKKSVFEKSKDKYLKHYDEATGKEVAQYVKDRPHLFSNEVVPSKEQTAGEAEQSTDDKANNIVSEAEQSTDDKAAPTSKKKEKGTGK